MSRPPATPAVRQLRVRVATLGVLYLALGALAALMFWRHAGGVVSGIGSYGGRVVLGSQVHGVSSIYETNPGPVTVLMALLVGATAVATASLWWRAAHHVTRRGVSGTVAAVVVGAMGVLEILTVGVFILPEAALMLVLSMPLDRLGETPTGGRLSAARS